MISSSLRSEECDENVAKENGYVAESEGKKAKEASSDCLINFYKRKKNQNKIKEGEVGPEKKEEEEEEGKMSDFIKQPGASKKEGKRNTTEEKLKGKEKSLEKKAQKSVSGNGLIEGKKEDHKKKRKEVEGKKEEKKTTEVTSKGKEKTGVKKSKKNESTNGQIVIEKEDHKREREKMEGKKEKKIKTSEVKSKGKEKSLEKKAPKTESSKVQIKAKKEDHKRNRKEMEGKKVEKRKTAEVHLKGKEKSLEKKGQKIESSNGKIEGKKKNHKRKREEMKLKEELPEEDEQRDSANKKIRKGSSKDDTLKQKQKQKQKHKAKNEEEIEYEKENGMYETSLYKFPMNRVSRIIKSEDFSGRISQEATFMINKASEKFLELFAKEAYASAFLDHKNYVSYDHLSSVVSRRKRFDFLADFVPEKVKAEEALTEMSKEET